MNSLVNERVFSLINKYNLTDAEFARKISATPAQLSNWKTGGRVIPEKYIIRTIEVFKEEDARWIIAGENTEKKEVSYYEEALKLKNEIIKEKERNIKLLEKYIEKIEK